MNPRTKFCHNPACPARGQVGQGNIAVQSQKDQRYRCTRCGRTFAATRGTPLDRLKKGADLVTLVVTLLCHGCPPQGIVAAFGLDERTVAAWQDRAGRHGQAVHEHLVQSGPVELGQVQADELWVQVVGGKVWMALALAVPFRLWLGGEVSAQRNLPLITQLVQRVRACARSRALLHQPDRPTAAMYLVGTVYNFCGTHESLRLAAPAGSSRKWQQRTPALAAGLTDHRWTMSELLHDQVPLPVWIAPKRRGRPPKSAQPPPTLAKAA